MKKLSEKQRSWLLAKSRKSIKLLQRKRKKKHVNNSHKTKNTYRTQKIIKAPRFFSILDNPDETVEFFNKVHNTIKALNVNDEMFFNLKDVEVVTVDAMMYLLALIKNSKRVKGLRIRCYGNVPAKKEPRRVIESSGFYDYFSVNYKIDNINKSNINISSGSETDSILLGKICDFVHANSNLNRRDTKPLFSMIIELMTNTKQHAYNRTSDLQNRWYIFVESQETDIQFVFLDTGLGIPATIRINFWEKIKKMMKIGDAKFIASALRGEFRTETNQDNRGKGLPDIYEKASKNIITDFSVISCKGRCDINMSGAIIERKMLGDLKGTLFYWRLNKSKGEN